MGWFLIIFIFKGAIVEEGEDAIEAAFTYALESINADRSLLVRTRLISDPDEKIPAGDSFKASKRVCKIARQGLTAIVGPNSDSAANHVQNMAAQMHVPHLETRFDYSTETPDYSINIHPHPKTLSKAYADLVKTLGWKSLAILFQNEDSLVKLQELLKLPKTFPVALL